MSHQISHQFGVDFCNTISATIFLAECFGECGWHEMSRRILTRLAVPFSVALISFLGYGSQILFYRIEPGPFEGWERLLFNCFMICILISYLRACFTDPGWVPRGWQHPITQTESASVKSRWCGKCNANKPARSHHCKICGRCFTITNRDFDHDD